MTIVSKPNAGSAVHTFSLPVVREIPPGPAPAGSAGW
jgi:hypothetical protein